MKKLSALIICAMLAISFTNCRSKESSQSTENANEETADVVYTCSMHPDVASKTPGKCPVCGMDLEKKQKGMNHDEMEHAHDSTAQK
jgi:Cu(I)/Ag(I) efflux system membrane fusion protein